MQALSGMQRNRADQKRLIPLWALPLFVVYASLSSIYLLVPPLLGVLFLLYVRAVAQKRMIDIVLIAAMLIVFEAEKGYLFASSILCFVLLERFVVPLLKQYIDCEPCRLLMQVALAYVGYTLLMLLLSQIFLFEMPAVDWRLAYYVLIEFVLLALI